MRDCGAHMSQLFAVPRIPKPAASSLMNIRLMNNSMIDISLIEERREVLETVIGALSRDRPDPDELAACSYLLKQLARSMGA
jgi:hypothetical protein